MKKTFFIYDQNLKIRTRDFKTKAEALDMQAVLKKQFRGLCEGFEVGAKIWDRKYFNCFNYEPDLKFVK